MGVSDYNGGDLCMTACKDHPYFQRTGKSERLLSLHFDSDGKSKEDSTKS